MLVLTAKIILIGSIIGMGTIIVKKIPVLSSLPISEEELKRKKGISYSSILKRVKERNKDFLPFLKSRFSNLKNLKRKFQGRENKFSDDYWEKIRQG